MGLEVSFMTQEYETSEFHRKYSIGKLLGKGSQGHVHACVHKVNQVECAVKMISMSQRSAWKAYVREVELCKATSSSNHVVRIFEEFNDPDYCYVVMEKFAGHIRKCMKWVQNQVEDDAILVLGGVGNAGLRSVVRQALSGILHLHRCEIVHRDIKSHNLLSDRLDLRDLRCRVVLSDFGLARRLEPGKLLSVQVGTRKYWSPEVYDKRYWNSVDVFALGVVMFLVATFTYPYLSEEDTRYRCVFSEEAVPNSLVMDGREFMKQLLIKDPCVRPTAEQMVAHPWLAPADGEMPTAMCASRVGLGLDESAKCGIFDTTANSEAFLRLETLAADSFDQSISTSTPNLQRTSPATGVPSSFKGSIAGTPGKPAAPTEPLGAYRGDTIPIDEPSVTAAPEESLHLSATVLRDESLRRGKSSFSSAEVTEHESTTSFDYDVDADCRVTVSRPNGSETVISV